MNIINLTPHTINVYDENHNHVIDIQASGTVARVDAIKKVVGNVNNIPLFETAYGEIVNLPEPSSNTMYIVSGLVKASCPERDDLLQPGELLRDDEGRPIGCVGFTR